MSDDQKPAPNKSGKFDDEPLPGKIGSSLRRLYDDVLSEDIPDDFLNLLKKADETKGKDEAAK